MSSSLSSAGECKSYLRAFASLLVIAAFMLISGCGGGGNGSGNGGGGGGGGTTSNPTPTISSLSPSAAAVGAAAQTLTITGTNFLSTSTVTYNNTAHTATYVSATQLTIQLSAGDQATAGSYPVVVTNPAPGGGASNAVNFVVAVSSPVPTITSLSPSAAVVGAAAQTLTITGTNFLSASTVTYSSTARTATYVSATQLTIQLSASDQATAGSYPVVVTNPAPGGGASNVVNFVVGTSNPVPAITSISPSSAVVGAAAQTLTITGTNFLSASTVTYNATAHAATYLSATQLAIQLSTSDQATAGSYPVVVTNPAPGGGASNAVDFVVSSGSGSGVQITSLSATSINPLTPLTITGTGFDPANAAISVLLVSESYNPPITVPVFAATSTSIEIMVPPLPVSGGLGGQTTFGGDVEDLQVIQVDGSTISTSNVYTGLNVNAPPALPSGAKVGDLTVYYLQSSLNVSATLQADATANSWSALGADLALNDANVNALIADIQFVQNNTSQSAALTTANGITLQLDENTLALTDQLIRAYVTQAASLVPSSVPAGMVRSARGKLLSRTEAVPGQSSACPSYTSDPSDDQFICSIQQTEQTKAAEGGKLLQLFGTLYYGAGIEILGAYASAAATAALWSADAIEAMELAWSAAGSYVAAAGTASDPPSPCDVIAGAGAKVLDDAAAGGVGIFSTTLSYLQLERDVAAIQNPSASSTPCPGPLLTGPSANAPSGTDPTIDYQTTNGTTTETLLAAPNTQQTGPTSGAVIPPAQVQTYTLGVGVVSGDGAIESFPEGILCGNCANDSATFPAGASVSLTATPAAGESLISWSGACSGVGSCTVKMNSDQSVSATFGAGQTYSANFNAPFNGRFLDPDGDSYAASASGTIIINVTANNNGAISGSASVPTYIGITVASCPGGNCETLPFSDTAAGPVSGSATGFTNTFTSSDGYYTMTFTGTLNSDGTITGSATFTGDFSGSSGGSSISTTLTGSIPSLTLTQQ